MNKYRPVFVIIILFSGLAIISGCESRKIDKEIKNLKASDNEIRKAAISALVSIGQPAVEPLIKALANEDIQVQIAAAQSLGRIGDTRAVEPLLEMIKGTFNIDLMFEIAVALSSIGDDKACELLREMERQEEKYLSKFVRNYLLDSGLCESK